MINVCVCVCRLILFYAGRYNHSSAVRIYELLEGYLRHKSDMVNLEAARAICEIPDASMKELHPAISGKLLQLLLMHE